ncbi:MAG: MFS transporter [Steroidobacteraceae bacterium]
MRLKGKNATAWYVVVVLCIGLFLSFTDRFIINLVVDPIRGDLTLTDVQISLLQGAGFALIYAVAGLPFGRLADSVNRRNLITGGVLLWSAATIACGLAVDFWSFFAARVAVGLGEAALIPAASSMIIDCFSARRRGIALGIFSLGAVLGAGVALLIGGLLLDLIAAGRFAGLPWIGAQAPWRQLMFLAGIPGFVLLPLLLLIREPARQHSSGLLPIADVFRRLIADNGAVLRVCLVKAILAIGDNGLISWMPTLLQRTHGLSPLEVGGILALSVSLSGAIASVTGGAVSDWFVRRWGVRSRVVLLLGCYTLTIAGAVAVFFAGTSQQAAIALSVWAFGSIAGYVIGHIVMQEWVPNEMRATTIAVSLAMSALIGIGLGPTIVALVAKHIFGGEGALQPAMGTVSLIAALLALLVIWPPIRSGIAALRN